MEWVGGAGSWSAGVRQGELVPPYKQRTRKGRARKTVPGDDATGVIAGRSAIALDGGNLCRQHPARLELAVQLDLHAKPWIVLLQHL